MGKLLLLLSLLSLLLLILGSMFAPNSAAMWLASTTTIYQLVRATLCVGLVVLILTRPPRSTFLRFITSIMAFGIMLAAVYFTYSGTLKVLDGLAFTAAGVSMGIAALEIVYNPIPLYRKIFGHNKQSKAKV